jgi:regulator of protease activity HflC (stomatin/prohibitin superfamily)
MDNTIITLVIIAVLLLVFLYIVSGIVRILPEYERLVILALGRYRGTRGPGLVIVLPFLEQAMKVDMREKFLDIPSQTAITKDNASIAIDFLVYYRIDDPMKAKLNVENVERASILIATTTLRAVIGDIDLDDVLSKREELNHTLRSKLDESTERWGMKITAVEIREIETPKLIQEAMNLQMSAERSRRAAVTQAQGQREADITVAEGQKQAAILKAEGEKQAAILKSEGERQSLVLTAQGYAAALEAINSKALDLDEKTMMLQYLDTMAKIGSSPSTRFVIPMELTSLAEKVASVAGLNGMSK